MEELKVLTENTLIGILQDLSDVRGYQGRKLTDAIRTRISIALDQAFQYGVMFSMKKMGEHHPIENHFPKPA
jgi:hypothetical protein